MKTISKEGRLNESSHALELLSKSLETFGKLKIDDLYDKIKDNEPIQRNNHPFLWNFDHGKVNNYSFGTRQQRKLFPHYHPPTWLGNKFLPLRGSPHTGPGCYTETDDVTPYPGMYQKVDTWNEKHKQCFAPFNALMPRFGTEVKGTSYPGPGTYNPEKKSPPKIVWPMKFGSPDWSQVPCLEKRTLKAELSTDKDFRKHRNRVAYFSLYYN
ncbi:protein pitchfork isoform X2 [Mesocricetus auratus]|uniref:Protein pitchfork isoform X2 n=1 Tax=Mesocricetus auratus TaxID=10036 RepID=A0ABM2XZE8_MESAU|nr:protein pitchfork isoform X2 [Mesocricetus auratus]